MGFILGMQGCFTIQKSNDIIHHINRLSKETHMIISVDEDKIQHPFLLETLSKVGIERNFLYLIKDIYEKLTPNIILNGERLSTFLLIVGTR